MPYTAPTKPPSPRTPPKAPAVLGAACLLCATVLTAPREGLVTRPTPDPAHILSVCYGERYVPMRVYSPDECGALLRARLRKDYAPKVAACLPGLVAQGRVRMLAAFIDAAYNAGPAAVCRSRMAVAARAGNNGAACSGFVNWYVTARDRRTGKVIALKGLVLRRQAEAKLCAQDFAMPTIMVPADFSRCVVVNPGPVRPRRKPVLYPNNSELT